MIINPDSAQRLQIWPFLKRKPQSTYLGWKPCVTTNALTCKHKTTTRQLNTETVESFQNSHPYHNVIKNKSKKEKHFHLWF